MAEVYPDVEILRQEIRELRQRLDDGPVNSKAMGNSMPKVTITKDPARPNESLKPTSFPIYDGDKTNYAAWRRAVLSILKMDWKMFGYTNSRVFLMIYKALEGKAQRQAGAYLEFGGLNGKERPEDFVEFLDRSNWDPTRVTRARNELNKMKMDIRQRWSSFFPLWANKLTEAQGENWPCETKITMLKGCLNYPLRVALASNHLLPEDDFCEWTRIVSQIALQHDELFKEPFQPVGYEKNIQNNPKAPATISTSREDSKAPSKEWTRSGWERGVAGDTDSTGDIFMAGVNQVGVSNRNGVETLISKWKSPEKIEQLRRERRCYRCVRKGCNTRICPLGPAEKPKSNQGPRVNITDLSSIDPSLYIQKSEDRLLEEVIIESEN